MEPYQFFAGIYDEYMDNVDYAGWAEYLVRTLSAHGISDGLVLDLGCGTGTMTELLAKAGYEMIGLDASDEMLAEAMDKKEQSGLDILYLCQQMQDFELFGTVRAVISVCDCLNYLLDPEDLVKTFRLVNNYLDPGGLFVFDMNTPCAYRQIGEMTIAENREDSSFIWENFFDEDSGINEYALTLFLKRQDGLYEKKEEVHNQRAYAKEEVFKMLQKANLEILAIYDAYTLDPPREDSTRLTFIARENGKKEFSY
ncbi:MAG: class I SAM-dependent methyltransferase [Blautia sp.]|nr:class I SAM-dependent methyltransferase [Blautia sp.]